MGSLRERLARKPPGYRFTIGRILAIYAGLMVALLLAALDQTIVATALPRVVSDLGGLSQYSWVFTAYLLASTVTVPLYGKLGDVYGRKPLFVFAIVVFLVGSALCGLAQNMTELVLFRGVQGLGAGGLFPLALAVVGSIVPPRHRGLYEGRVPETILPFDLMRNPTVAASLLCMALVGMAMFGTISFVPLFVQGVIGTSATSSGVVLTPLMLGAVTASFISGQWVSRSGRVRPNAISGPIVLTAGMVLLWRMNASTTNGQAARDMVIVGIGLGLMMQVFVLAVQNAVPRARIGSATAMTQFARSIGATLGVTVMGVIVNQGLPRGVSSQGVAVHRLHGALRVGLAHALRPAFFAGLVVSTLVLPIVLVGIRDIQLRHGFEDVVIGDEPSPQPATAAAAPPARAD